MRHLLLITIIGLMNAVDVMAQYNIIPQPVEIVYGEGSYRLPSDIEQLRVHERRDGSLAREAYRLEVTNRRITITASSAEGFYYGRQTLNQMVAQSDGELAAVTINDAPRFGYRGFMLDVVRTYVPLDEIKRIVDVMAELKLNTLHLHLTDDNGWRLEIKRYPRLTDVGAWRVDRPELFPGRLNARSADEAATYGGWYTQDEMRELVRYCAERHINVLPEIEMPAHSAALLASYPELACPVVDKFIGVFPGIGGRDASIICCAGNERVYEVYEGILDEVMDIFPSQQIHLGGDEADKTMWNQCPRCQAKIQQEGLADSEALQGYFMDRINRYVQAHGRTAIGWDEVTMGHPHEDITIMGWRGDGTAAINYSRQTGSKFILTPAKKLYLIRYQGPQRFEPFTYFGNNTLRDCYEYEPVAVDWTAEMEQNLLGVQGSMWNEFCPTAEAIQYMVFPRLIAIADMAWRPKGVGDWAAFIAALDAYLPRLEELGVNYSRSMYNLFHTVEPIDGVLKVTLSCLRPDVEIRYATSEEALSASSAVYSEPITIGACSMTLYAAAFKDGVQVGQTLALDLRFNVATAQTVRGVNCQNGLARMLVNGMRGSDRISDGEWAGWYNRTAEFVVDLGEVRNVNRITLGNLVHSDICVVAPKRVCVYGSEDGETYTLLSEQETADDVVWHTDVLRNDVVLCDAPTVLRYIKVVATNPGVIPDGMAREGMATWMYFDEIMVE